MAGNFAGYAGACRYSKTDPKMVKKKPA